MENEGIKGRKKRKLSSPTVTFESFIYGQEQLSQLVNKSKKLRTSPKENDETPPKIFIEQTDRMRLKALNGNQQNSFIALTEKQTNIRSKTVEQSPAVANIKNNEPSSTENNLVIDTKKDSDKSLLKKEKDPQEKEKRKAKKRAKKRAEKERRKKEKRAIKAALKQKKRKKNSKKRWKEERHTMR